MGNLKLFVADMERELVLAPFFSFFIGVTMNQKESETIIQEYENAFWDFHNIMTGEEADIRQKKWNKLCQVKEKIVNLLNGSTDARS